MPANKPTVTVSRADSGESPSHEGEPTADRRTIHHPTGSSTTPAPTKRMKAMSNGVRERWALARATTMKAVHIATVTNAAPTPSTRGLGRRKEKVMDAIIPFALG